MPQRARILKATVGGEGGVVTRSRGGGCCDQVPGEGVL